DCGRARGSSASRRPRRWTSRCGSPRRSTGSLWSSRAVVGDCVAKPAGEVEEGEVEPRGGGPCDEPFFAWLVACADVERMRRQLEETAAEYRWTHLFACGSDTVNITNESS